MQNKKLRLVVIISAFLMILVSAIGITYAYFSIQVTGNEETSSVKVQTAILRLIYTDTLVMEGRDIYPGWSKTKTITVENTGTVKVYYNIIWREIINTITNGELTMSMTCSSNVQGNTCYGLSDTIIPTFTSETSNIPIKDDIGIDPGERHTYTVTVTFPELSTNQNYNQGKMFRGTLNISEGKEVGTLTAGDEVAYGTEHFYVVSSNQNETVLLSKYNLLVGRTYSFDNNGDSFTQISLSTNGYGLQNSTARGWVEGNSGQYVGVVPFVGSTSGTGYWHDTVNDDIYSKYGTYNEYKNNIYDTDYVSAPNWNYGFSADSNNVNYSIAYYVEEYVNKMKLEKNLPLTAVGRLLTYEEAKAFGNIAKYDVDVDQCIAGGTIVAMQTYSMDETTASQAATSLCNGEITLGVTLGGMLNDGSIGPEYYSLLGLSNVELVGSELYSSSFWLGSASAFYRIRSISSNSTFSITDFYNEYYNGVRPVIVVNTSDISS